MLRAVDYIFNLRCAFNSLQPMKKFVFSVASRATGRLQIKPSGSGDENVRYPVGKSKFGTCAVTGLCSFKAIIHTRAQLIEAWLALTNV